MSNIISAVVLQFTIFDKLKSGYELNVGEAQLGLAFGFLEPINLSFKKIPARIGRIELVQVSYDQQINNFKNEQVYPIEAINESNAQRMLTEESEVYQFGGRDNLLTASDWNDVVLTDYPFASL